MTNAEAFSYYFGIYATELWAMPEAQFLEWLNTVCDTNVGDTISRQAVIDMLEMYPFEKAVNCISSIEELPSIQLVQHGHWQYGDDFYENAICSCCEWDSSEPMEYAKNNFLFCPNCGAKMDEER